MSNSDIIWKVEQLENELYKLDEIDAFKEDYKKIRELLIKAKFSSEIAHKYHLSFIDIVDGRIEKYAQFGHAEKTDFTENLDRIKKTMLVNNKSL